MPCARPGVACAFAIIEKHAFLETTCGTTSVEAAQASAAANIVMDCWEYGKLDVIPSYAIMKGQSCLGIAREQATVFFAWAIGNKAEGIPYRHCHRDEDHIRCPAWCLPVSRMQTFMKA